MIKKNFMKQALTAWFIAAAMVLTPLAAVAQTRVEAPKNRYSVRDDVQAGRQAAQQAEQQLPILNDRSIQNYVNSVGNRLVRAIPSQFQQPAFDYSFKVVNARDINAFALPGGFTYVNRGLIDAARTEGELAGVMAHEIAHVALRHGTAQATKAQSPGIQLGAIAGAILGSVVGGNLGGLIYQGTQTGLGLYSLKYSRDYERQSDILGAQIMARAGYDPRDLANMFRTIERASGGGGGPEFLSSHPNPGNRYERINQEAALLRVTNPVQNTNEFRQVQAELRRMGRAPSMQEIAQSGQRNPTNTRTGGTYTGRVEPPSGRYRTYTAGNFLRVAVPENWRETGSGNSVALIPEGGYVETQNGGQFTHGVLLGVEQSSNRNLARATENYVNELLRGNPNLRQQTRYQRGTISGRNALMATLAGRSNVTGQVEQVNVYTTLLRNGELFYMVAIAPQNEYRNYQRTFDDMLRSLELNG